MAFADSMLGGHSPVIADILIYIHICTQSCFSECSNKAKDCLRIDFTAHFCSSRYVISAALDAEMELENILQIVYDMHSEGIYAAGKIYATLLQRLAAEVSTRLPKFQHFAM